MQGVRISETLIQTNHSFPLPPFFPLVEVTTGAVVETGAVVALLTGVLVEDFPFELPPHTQVFFAGDDVYPEAQAVHEADPAGE